MPPVAGGASRWNSATSSLLRCCSWEAAAAEARRYRPVSTEMLALWMHEDSAATAPPYSDTAVGGVAVFVVASASARWISLAASA